LDVHVKSADDQASGVDELVNGQGQRAGIGETAERDGFRYTDLLAG